jgi:hypothetical protein
MVCNEAREALTVNCAILPASGEVPSAMDGERRFDSDESCAR